MKILSAVYNGFNRMELNDVRHFSITMTQMIQLILGTNGSGKSSLMEELSPLPADQDNYYKGGSKTINISHNGSIYRAESLFTGPAKHYLWKDGVCLNEGGTAPSMLEVVKQEFGLTKEYWRLITDKEKFTTMGPARRREWMTMLADTNYDYAIGLFNRLKERSRDTTGALKRARADLVHEKNKLMSEAEERKLRAEAEQLHRDLNVLMDNRAPLDQSPEFHYKQADGFMKQLNEALNRLFKLKITIPAGKHPLKPEERNEWGELERPHFNNVDEVTETITHLGKNVSSVEALLNNAVREHRKHTDAIEMMMRTGAEGIDALTTKLKDARDRKLTTLAKRRLKLEGIETFNCVANLGHIYDDLLEIFTNIPVNEDKRYSSAAEQKWEATLFDLTTSRGELEKEIAVKQQALKHMDSHRDSGMISCPKCNHVWKEGYNPETYRQMSNAIDLLGVSLEVVKKDIAAAKDELEDNRTYGNYWRKFIRLTQSYTNFKPFWSYLLENEYVSKNPRFAVSVLETFRYDCQVEQDAVKISDEIVEIVRFIQAAEETGNTSLEQAELHRDETQANIDEYTAVLHDLRTQERNYLNYRSDLNDAIRLGALIEDLQNNAERATKEAVEAMRLESISLCIRQLQSAVGRKEDVLQHISVQRGIIEQLEYRVIKLEQEEAVLKIMVEEISPTTGMIAEGLLGFIRVFVSQMNTLVKKIWSYPLVVYPCGSGGNDGAELDYKFPMKVQSKTRKDVALGSTGICEIIDVAFKVTAMEHMGLSEFPLFLDEFGAALDEVHRVQSMQVIKNLMEQKSFTQLFMVSHYEASYGSLTQAEICVLCSANITIPPSMTYNKHVVLA